MKIEDQIKQLMPVIEEQLKAQLLTGARFKLYIEGVRSKVDAVYYCKEKRTDNGHITECHKITV